MSVGNKDHIDSLKIVNGTVGRGIKLVENFNVKFTKYENQKQFLLQVSSEKLYLYVVLLKFHVFTFGLFKNTVKFIKQAQ